jgi:hypothetical protein
MNETLNELARARDNDYSALEDVYRQTTGGELVSDPSGSARHSLPGLTLSASVVIPAWNARETLAQCLTALNTARLTKSIPTKKSLSSTTALSMKRSLPLRGVRAETYEVQWRQWRDNLCLALLSTSSAVAGLGR